MRRLLGDGVTRVCVARVVVAIFLCALSGCGGSRPPGPSPFVGRITLSPSPSTSLQVGGVLSFLASAQNASGLTMSATFTFQSSDTSILNIAPNGVACAGRFDATFTTCTALGTGVVQVTASTLGATSATTLVFVHPPIDQIQISEVIENSPPPACPGQQIVPATCAVSFTASNQCMSPNQVRTIQANAFSKGVDITALVGPITWSEGNPNAVRVTPVASSSNNTPTNQATVTPGTPGFTPVFATVSGVSSQPYYAESCPVQCIALELGASGSQTGGQTSFSTTKGTAETITATAVDVQGCVVPKPSLTWSSSQPASVSASSCSSVTSCSVSTAQPGAGSVTASCTPPSCNIGFPQSVGGLPQALVQPLPVYPVTPISGVVSGTASSAGVLATSTDCKTTALCSVNLYTVSTAGTIAGVPTPLPTPPDSLLFDLAGDKAYVGSNYGAQLVTISNLGSATNPFSTLGTVTGKVLAVSPNGSAAIFSDTFHTPNQVFVVNTAGASPPPLNISGATAAAFSPDGLKAFIIGCVSNSVPCNSNGGTALNNGGNTLYIYSALQSMQTIPLSAAANAVTFSANGAFAFVSGGATNSLTAYNVCNNGLATTVPLPVTPAFLQTLPDGVHLIALDNTGFDYITTSVMAAPFPSQCPQTLTLSSRHISLGQGTFNPVNIFVSPDGTLVYVVASDRSSVLVYSFNTNSTSGIPLANGALGQSVSPVAASMTVDGTLIYVIGSDGTLHQLSTLTSSDALQISFPPTSTSTNGFCSSGASTIPCTLNFVAVRP